MLQKLGSVIVPALKWQMSIGQTSEGCGCAHRYGCMYMLMNAKYIKLCEIKYGAG